MNKQTVEKDNCIEFHANSSADIGHCIRIALLVLNKIQTACVIYLFCYTRYNICEYFVRVKIRPYKSVSTPSFLLSSAHMNDNAFAFNPLHLIN